MYRLPTKSDLSYVLQAAVAVDNAAGGCVRLLTSEGALHIVEWTGLNAAYFTQFDGMVYGTVTSYAQALTERRRVVIRDIETDIAFAPQRPVARAAGFRSVQSTPLVDSEFGALGILSTYFADPHHPGPESLAALDAYCIIASLLIEVDTLHHAVVEADRRLSTPPRALPETVAEAAAAARRLLPTLVHPGHGAATRSAAAHLETVVRHLRSLVHHAYGSNSQTRQLG
ncbi:MAG: GAF domain-containing protein [Xanthomonadaceae bacterium]|nr:GAF domain-containing protein [Xanthomonadaceae bacterium]